MTDTPEARTRALLDATHKFPVDFAISVIAENSPDTATAIRDAVEAGLTGPLTDGAYQVLPSRGGKYLSHRFVVPCAQAQDVLDLYERLRRVTGVVTLL